MVVDYKTAQAGEQATPRRDFDTFFAVQPTGRFPVTSHHIFLKKKSAFSCRT
jgi:hypothetical protein